MKTNKLVIGGMLVLVFLILRLIHLNSLPVFADEAIYIRWAQLMSDDFGRYVFLPMQDGKTPLHMIVLSRFLWLNRSDPLLVSRLMSIGFGAVNLGLLVYLIKILKGGWLAQILGASLYIVLPFSLFHDRMGLIDTMLVTFLLASFVGFLKIQKTGKWLWVVFAGIAYGLALWTKLPALFFVPAYVMLFLVMSLESKTVWKPLLLQFFVAGMIGISIFLTLRTSPVFPSLFTRGQDFSFGVTQVLSGQVSQIPSNAEKLIRWMVVYVTGGVVVSLILLLITNGVNDLRRHRKIRAYVWLMIMAGIFCLPILFFGKVVASRYYLPILIFVIPAVSLGLEEWWREGKRILVGIILGSIIIQSLWFDFQLIYNPAQAPFAREDVVQYLTEWSAGYGIPDVVSFIRETSSEEKVVFATEGYFGTLPDGLLMYFDRSELISNGKLEIFGIGQPVRELSRDVISKAKEFDTYLLVNEHRFLIKDDGCCQLVASYPRPRGGPALLLFKVNQ